MKDKGDIVRLKAQVMAFGGSAKARNLEDPGDPASYFVTLCAPGDVVQARVLERKDRYARAEALSILEPSPHRTTPRCNVFGKCGGCHWQHLDYAEQLVQKADVLGFTISRALDEIPAVEPALASPDPYGYRHRATFKARRKGSTLEIGFFAQRSRRIVEIDACPILAPAIRELPGMLRDLPRDLDPAPEGIFEIEAACGDTDDAVALLARPVEDKPTKKNQGRFLELDGGRFRQAEPERDLYYTASGETIGFSAGDFTQANLAANDLLVREVVARLTENRPARLLELYCGVGNFTVAASRLCGEVIGVEVNPRSVARARRNLEEADIRNARLYAAQVHEALEILRSKDAAPDVLLCDPPRSGLGKTTVHVVSEMRPRRILVVSCHPRSLSADLKGLTDAGYRVCRITPFDLFPQTFHVEALVELAMG